MRAGVAAAGFVAGKCAWALAIALIACASSAAAQEAEEPTAQDTAAARALFEEGVGLADAERWPEAADRFRRSLALRPSPVVAYNLASALVHLNGLVEASELLRGIVRDESVPEAARTAARALLAEVEPRLGRLTIRLEGDPTDAEVRLDDRVVPAEAVGVAIPADPGTRTVRVVRGQDVVAEGTVEVPEGGTAALALEVPAPPPPAEPQPGDQGFRPGDVFRIGESGEGEPAEGYRPGDILRSESEPAPAASVPSPEETARAAPRRTASPAPTRPAQDEPGSVWTNPWFWGGVGAGVLVTGAVVLALVLGGGSDEPPGIQGTLDPGLIELGR